MDDLAAQAGAGGDIRRYLKERGLTASGDFALVAESQDQFDAFVVAPLFAGWQPDPAVEAIQIAESERPIARAILRFMWTLAREARARIASSSVPAGVAQLSATPGATGSASVTPDQTKIPKHLPPGAWRDMIDRYNAVTVNGEQRSFPRLNCSELSA